MLFGTANQQQARMISKGTGPKTVLIEAQNSAGAKAQVEAQYPGAYNIMPNQVPPYSTTRNENGDLRDDRQSAGRALVAPSDSKLNATESPKLFATTEEVP
jgi:hypothetical protein